MAASGDLLCSQSTVSSFMAELRFLSSYLQMGSESLCSSVTGCSCTMDSSSSKISASLAKTIPSLKPCPNDAVKAYSVTS